MEKQRLLQTLEQLQSELARADRVDPDTLVELERLTEEIRQKLEEHDAKGAVDEPESGLRDLMLKYEADHPQLAAAIGRVADALAAMGF